MLVVEIEIYRRNIIMSIIILYRYIVSLIYNYWGTLQTGGRRLCLITDYVPRGLDGPGVGSRLTFSLRGCKRLYPHRYARTGAVNQGRLRSCLGVTNTKTGHWRRIWVHVDYGEVTDSDNDELSFQIGILYKYPIEYCKVFWESMTLSELHVLFFN